MSLHEDYDGKFLAASKAGGEPPNDANRYGVQIAPAAVADGAAYWKVIGVHHLAPEENRGRHNAFVEALDEGGRRVQDPNLRIGWTWEGRHADEAAPPKALDKPASEPAGDVPIEKGMKLELWIEGDGASDHVRNLTPIGPMSRRRTANCLTPSATIRFMWPFSARAKGLHRSWTAAVRQPLWLTSTSSPLALLASKT